MKAEYDFSKMKSRGHPLRNKVQRGEVVLVNPFEISKGELEGHFVEDYHDSQLEEGEYEEHLAAIERVKAGEYVSLSDLPD